MSDRRRDDDVLDLLDELGDTLDELGTELREERDREGRRRTRTPQPPSFGEILRFTESYTIPTVIAVLEATIASLELLRRLMRLSDPSRAMEDTRNDVDARIRDVPRSAVTGVDRALTELRTALSEADLPSNPEARDVLERARSLADELDERIADAERERTTRERRWRQDEQRFESQWRRGSDDRRARDDDRTDHGTGPVRIDVTEEGSESVDDTEDEPTVDVDAELESIKQEVNGDDSDAGGDDGDDKEPSDY